MSSRLRTLLGILVLITLIVPSTARSQPAIVEADEITADSCRDEVNKALSKEHRLYRSVIFGQRKAEEASVGEVRHDQEGNVWIKIVENEWRSAAEKYREDQKDDSQMDDLSDTEPRRGIFETRRVLTSELIPPLTQSVRALRCRLAMVCEVARRSIDEEGKDPKTITPSVRGCIEMEQETFPSCHLVAGGQTKQAKGDVLKYCDDVSKDLLEREVALLQMTVEYDTAYRSLLQFAGNLDTFLEEWRWTLLGTLRQAAGLVGLLQRIPCFLSSCDEFPEPEENQQP